MATLTIVAASIVMKNPATTTASTHHRRPGRSTGGGTVATSICFVFISSIVGRAPVAPKNLAVSEVDRLPEVKTAILDGLDRQLLHALAINGRASFRRIATV